VAAQGGLTARRPTSFPLPDARTTCGAGGQRLGRLLVRGRSHRRRPAPKPAFRARRTPSRAASAWAGFRARRTPSRAASAWAGFRARRTPSRAASAWAGFRARRATDPATGQRVQGDPRGPGGPPYKQSCWQPGLFTGRKRMLSTNNGLTLTAPTGKRPSRQPAAPAICLTLRRSPLQRLPSGGMRSHAGPPGAPSSVRQYYKIWPWGSSGIRERLRRISQSMECRSKRRRRSSAIRWGELWLTRAIRP